MNKSNIELRESLLKNIEQKRKEIKIYEGNLEQCKTDWLELHSKLKELDKEDTHDVISVFDMKDNDIGVIMMWDGMTMYGLNGRVIQRQGNDLVGIGKNMWKLWTDIMEDTHRVKCRHLFKVKLVKQVIHDGVQYPLD